MSHKIKSVVVRGFKSHMDSTFEYAPGLTVVTGPSDTGKSAGVIQPIKWVTFGEPSGEDFLFTIRDEETQEIVRQAEFGEVIITTDDGMVIKKHRRKGKTTWYLNDMEKPLSEKAETPDEVKLVLGMKQHKYGEDFETSLNFAYQLETPFILSETPSVGAKVLGKLAGTEIVDKAIGAIGKKVYKARDDKASAQKSIDRTNVELVEYLLLDDLITSVAAVEALIAEVEQYAAKATAIRQLQGRYSLVDDGLAACSIKLKRLEVVPTLTELMAAIDKDLLIADVMYPLYVKYFGLDEQISQSNRKLRKLEVLPDILKLIEELTTAYMDHTAIFSLRDECYSLQTRIKGKDDTLASMAGMLVASELIVRTEEEYKILDALYDLEYRYRTVSLSVLSKQDRLVQFEHLPESEKLLAEVGKDYERLEVIKVIYTDFQNKDEAASNASRNLEKAIMERINADEELQEAWEESGGKCPLCGQAVYGEHIH